MNAPLLEVRDLSRHFSVARPAGLLRRRRAVLRAVDGISFTLRSGRTLGLVGESGCGKSTAAALCLGLLQPTGGEVRFAGESMPAPDTAAWRRLRRRMQLVFQNPLAALDRRLPIGRQVAEPLDIHGIGRPEARKARTLELMEAVGLGRHQLGRYPHELSGGQRQRVVLARALALDPALLVCDEPISALDVSIQAQVINLLLDLQERLGIALLFISHDLKVVRQISHEVAVMYLGRIVEHGDADRLFAAPAHPYTQALVSAIPSARIGTPRQRIVLRGDPPNPVDVPGGCAFHTRCPVALERCRSERPALRPMPDGRMVACHRAEAAALPQAA